MLSQEDKKEVVGLIQEALKPIKNKEGFEKRKEEEKPHPFTIKFWQETVTINGVPWNTSWGELIVWLAKKEVQVVVYQSLKNAEWLRPFIKGMEQDKPRTFSVTGMFGNDEKAATGWCATFSNEKEAMEAAEEEMARVASAFPGSITEVGDNEFIVKDGNNRPLIRMVVEEMRSA